MVVSSASSRRGRGGSGAVQELAGQTSLSHPVGFAHLRSGIDGHGLSEGISVAEGK